MSDPYRITPKCKVGCTGKFSVFDLREIIAIVGRTEKDNEALTIFFRNGENIEILASNNTTIRQDFTEYLNQ